MKANTAASLQVDDLEKAKYLSFDPAYYDSILRCMRADTWSESYCLSSSVPTMSWAPLAPVVATEAITPQRVEQLSQLVTHSATRSDDWVPYIIKASLNSARNDTRARMDPERTLPGLIDQFRYHRKIGFAARIADRLDYLLEVSREEQPEQAPPSAGSLEGFLAFLVKNPGLTYPAIVLTFEGNIRAQWTRDPDHHFAIEFCENDDVRFVIFAPDPKHRYKTVRVSGTATVDSVMGQAHYYQVNWAMAECVQAA